MRRTLWLGCLLAATGCQPGDADRLERAGRRAVDNIWAVGVGARGQLARGWQALHNDLAEAVRNRLAEDESLAGIRLDVRAEAGTVILNGQVSTEEQRRRAEELAGTTPGVRAVRNELTLQRAEPE